jgi:hypothetical protein
MCFRDEKKEFQSKPVLRNSEMAAGIDKQQMYEKRGSVTNFYV